MVDIEHIFDNIDTSALAPEVIASFQEMLLYIAELEKGADAEDVSSDDLVAVFDQRHITSRAKTKWYSPNAALGDRSGATRLTKKKGICFHHTAVRGGFGADKSLVRKYEKEPVDMERFRSSTRPLTTDEWARALALAHRYRGDPPRQYNYGVPYHAVHGPNSVLYLNLPFDWVTWHGNGANNDFLGVAWDARSTAEQPYAEDLVRDLKLLIEIARAEGHPITEFTCHCAWTNKPDDPGAAFIQQVMVPVAGELGIEIDWDFKDRLDARSLGQVVGRQA
jgi:hypothetical protein